ncbi:MAG: GxxExxY protein [Opitutus sp.]|nr:GxxExxY protein [Opitutus sp.]
MGTDEYLHKELSQVIVGAAMTVLNTRKPGLKEKAYENALAIELRKRGLVVEQQRSFDVIYDGPIVDTLVPDLVVEGKVVVDPKCAADFTGTHTAQMVGHRAITGLRLAILLTSKN